MPFDLPPSAPPAETRPVLIVEDDVDVLDVAATILRGEGYQVLVAGDGVAAFRLFERHPDIALVFTDIKMPKIDGLMLADMAQLRRPDIKILYTTAYGREADRQPGYRYGEILAKPYRRAQLVAAVERALQEPPKRLRPWQGPRGTIPSP
jgi:CheY-like chemotaxis protein